MADKMLNAFDVWITAQGVKSRTRLRSVDNISLEGIGRLRELILDMAVRGRLLPQEKSDEDASVLLKVIANQKNKLISEGLLKKENPLPEITSTDFPFEKPKGWVFARLGEITNKIGSGSTPRGGRESYKSEGTLFIRSQNVLNSKLDLSDAAFITSQVHDQMSNTKVQPNDILLNITGGSLGRCAIYPDDIGEANVSQHVTIIRLTNQSTNKFLHLCLLSPYGQKLIWGRQVGANREGLSKKVLEQFEIPLPPLAEQHRIVAKVDELMALCDALEQQEMHHLKSHRLLVETLLGTLTRAADTNEFQHAWNKLYEHFDDLFTTEDSIDQLKQTILQLAVMGKLVPQDPKDEPASELLKKIAKEKERLVEEGVIKKEKALPDIQDSEIPFKVPSSWAFARLGEITNKIGSGSTPRGGRESYSDEGILFLRSQNIYNYGLELSDVAFISNETHERMSGTKVFPGDILLNITGGSLGRSTIFPSDVGEANVSQHVTIIRPTNSQTRFFLHLCIMSPYGQELIWGRQVGANREGLSKRILELFEFPIPPLEEQDRIVSKVDELFALCDRLKARIAEAQKVANQMAEGVVV